MKQPLMFLSLQLSSTRRLAVDYIKQPLLFLSFNYPQRDVWPLFILRNLCCFYRSIILDAPVSHCIYKATFFLSFNYPQRAVYIVYLKQPLLVLSFNYPQRSVCPLFILSNLCCFFRSILLKVPFGHCLP